MLLAYIIENSISKTKRLKLSRSSSFVERNYKYRNGPKI